MRSNQKPRVLIVFAMLIVMLAAGCSSGEPGDLAGGQTAQRTADDGDRLSLSDVCPATIVVQSSWWTQAEHFAAYQLLGDGYAVDAERKRVTGPLVAEDADTGEKVDTGIDLQIRAGGPAIGFEKVTAQMHLDQEITLGMVPTDEIIQQSADQPVTAVMAPLDRDPQVLLWDPEQHPDWKVIQDIGQTDVTVQYAESTGTYMAYLLGSGMLRESQVDSTYDGSPTRFLAEGGKIVIQGFSTNEPYTWANELPAWNKPLEYSYIDDTGYENYRHVLAIRSGELKELQPCLERLVPILQQGVVAFMADPDPVIKLVLSIVEATDQPSNDSVERSRHAVNTLRGDGIVTNGTNETIGDFDLARLEELISITAPIYAAQGQPIKPEISPDDIATNAFIDPEIGLPAADS